MGFLCSTGWPAAGCLAFANRHVPPCSACAVHVVTYSKERAGKIAQSIKCLPHKLEDLRLQNLHLKEKKAMC